MADVLKGHVSPSSGLFSHQHPYFPEDLKLPGYEHPVIPFGQILAVFFAASAILFLAVYVFSGQIKHLSAGERATLCWFALTGIIHLVVEGAVVSNADFYKDKSGNFLHEIWKEYAKADSRYASRDAFTICMEAVTAFIEGPLCFVIIYGMAKRSPWRYTMQFAVSLGQLYGDVLYFATCWFEGLKHSRPEPLYFWFYFVFINSIWVVVPFICMYNAARAISTAVAKGNKHSKSH
ncbi:hypothetical protein WJX72_005605 [[Myrmecia] bisecta]|uniref:EXPERA domain-containing protein n=1 Tax=[Myrmecia] bisecta TaxID=41462 RepID=A0AAW1QF44_9CHLO